MEWNDMVRVVNSVESTEISKKLWTSGHESDEHCGTRFPLSANSWTKKGKPVTEFLRRAFQQKSLREEQNQGAKAFDSNALCNADHDRYGKRGKATLSLKENRFEYFAPSPSMNLFERNDHTAKSTERTVSHPGMPNFGSSCYVNATLQVLLNLHDFVHAIISLTNELKFNDGSVTLSFARLAEESKLEVN